MMRRTLVFLVGIVACLTVVSVSCADGPADNHPDKVRRVPKLGIEVPPAEQQALQKRLDELAALIEGIRQSKDAANIGLLPDVLIYHRAVDSALKHQEFFAPSDIRAADELLDEGIARAKLLTQGDPQWTRQTGLVVRGFISRLDKTVQPYGLVIPANYDGSRTMRLDVWFHGRGETLSEVKFLQGRRKQAGVFAPDNTIVLHPYGRYSNANKFAGEVDVLEGIQQVHRHYRTDRNRTAVRGFSMGGASTWQLAVHYPTDWVAANPGAGFSETPEFLRTFQQETLRPTWWERKLWQWYDCDDWAVNLSHCPTVAYSGADDRQKQAADVMEAALAKEGIQLIHEIGPNTGHRYHPQSRERVDRRMSQIAAIGRRQVPRHIHFVTYTLRYNRCGWLTIDGLNQHWEQARVDGRLTNAGIQLDTKNITAMTFRLTPGMAPFNPTKSVELQLDGQKLNGGAVRSDRSWDVSVELAEGKWRVRTSEAATDGLQKRHLLQGPIDDAFMDAFLFVAPTGKSQHQAVDQWSRAELERAIEHWRRHFRGEAQVRDDLKVTDDEIRDHNLVLWGDPQSNALIRRVVDQLPIQWDEKTLSIGGKSFDVTDHAPVMIFPNPLNPNRYVVLNSSFTYREYAYLNNARQVPMLPDWAIVDLRQPPTSQWPGKISAAGFFDERWKVRTEDLERPSGQTE